MSHRFRLVSFVVALCLLSTFASADDRSVVFEGFDLKVEQVTDAMTDAKTCALFVESGWIYLSVESPSKVTIFSNNERLHFSPDDKHLVRIGSDAPGELSFVANRNALSATNGAEIVKALAAGRPITIRYFDWPSHESQDVTVEAPAFAYAWGKSEKQCGWPGLGVSGELPGAKLSVHESTVEGHEGYARVSVAGNQKLGLTKGFDEYGGGCHIAVGNNETVGMQAGRWTSAKLDFGGRAKLTVRDQVGAVILEAGFPTEPTIGSSTQGNKWDRGEAVARAMWQVAPLGTVSVTGTSYEEKNLSLYGFRELWQWGKQKCSFPSLE